MYKCWCGRNHKYYYIHDRWWWKLPENLRCSTNLEKSCLICLNIAIKPIPLIEFEIGEN